MSLNIFKKKHQKNNFGKFYQVGKYNLKLKSYHQLDDFQRSFPLYDKFLPLFCSQFEGLIVDVGANIGDTSIAIFAQNENCYIIGIEPDPEFYEDCLENINRNNLSERFFGINKFVTSKTGNYTVKRSENQMTGSIDFQNQDHSLESLNTITFKSIFEIFKATTAQKFNLLKIDTDGFDWDVINTFCDYALMEKYIPEYVHFEMQTFENNKQFLENNRNEIIENYNNSLLNLKNVGYTHFCLFDNYGTHFKITNSVDEIFEMNNYIKRSQLHNKHNTIYYFDVLAFSEDKLEYVKNCIQKLYL